MLRRNLTQFLISFKERQGSQLGEFFLSMEFNTQNPQHALSTLAHTCAPITWEAGRESEIKGHLWLCAESRLGSLRT